MKRKITLPLLLILIITATSVEAQDYYWSANKKIILKKDLSGLIFNIHEKSNQELLVLANDGRIESIKRINPNTIFAEIKPSVQVTLKSFDEKSPNNTTIYKTLSGNEMLPTGYILLKPKKGISIKKIKDFLGLDFKIIEEKYGVSLILIDNYGKLLETANIIYESGYVEYCHPDFIAPLKKTTTDPLYDEQYYLDNTGQFGGMVGIDINAPEAWDISTGLHKTRVAVLDDGVENHEDIQGRVVQGYTATNPNGFGAPGPGSDHGQACAGIIAASHNNNLGIAGVAPCTDIVPVRVLGINASVAQIGGAIDWAWDEGEADVLSNSWRFEDPNVYFDAIEDAITRARTMGRNDKGSVVVFASGNENMIYNGVAHPADVPGALTVGAIDKNGNIHNYSSRGPEMDLVAPSGGGNVVTTDRPGNAGYNNSDYTYSFGGTSAAAPQVSGVAALMLSVNPNLTESQVASKLKNTATDMGPTGFDTTFGDGRVDAEAALNSALPDINGLTTFCPSATFAVNVPAGGTVNWSVSPSSALTFTQGEPSTTFTRNGSFNGWATITATLSSNCGSLTTSKNVLIEPTINMTITDVQPGPIMHVSATATGGNAPYKWYINGVLQKTTSSPDVLIRYRCTGVGLSDLEVRSTTGCGVAARTAYFYDDCSSSYQMIVYPNPTSSEIFIVTKDNQQGNGEILNAASTTFPMKLELFDFEGRLMVQEEFEQGAPEIKLNISNLRRGNYFLKIQAEGVDEVHQIIVE